MFWRVTVAILGLADCVLAFHFIRMGWVAVLSADETGAGLIGMILLLFGLVVAALGGTALFFTRTGKASLRRLGFRSTVVITTASPWLFLAYWYWPDYQC